MFNTYIKCANCNKYALFDSSYALHLERNIGSAVKSRGKFGTYICENCAQELIEMLDEEENNGTTEETKDEP